MATVPWTLHSAWLPSLESQDWLKVLQGQLAWEQPEVLVYGKRHPTPRLAAFLADEGVSYRYSGVLHRGSGWPVWFLPLLDQVNQQCSTRFNGCLFNCYRNGDDRMGWHADDEPEIDASQPIASLSLGATRTFQLKQRRGDERHSLELADGDLLVMEPLCQEDWVHALPVRKRVSTVRVNLTFRVFQAA